MGLYAVVLDENTWKGMSKVEYCGMWQLYLGAFDLPGFCYVCDTLSYGVS